MSNVGTEATNVVRVYDSLGTPLPLHTKKQIAAMLKTKERSIKMEFANVQKQHNYSDCVYAIANAIAICIEEQPECLLYDTQFMRRHLAGCFEDDLMRHFPATKRSIRKMTRRCEVMPVFCIMQNA